MKKRISGLIPFFVIRVATNSGLARIRARMYVMNLEIWYQSVTRHFGGLFVLSERSPVTE
jgi:hypothetical protein